MLRLLIVDDEPLITDSMHDILSDLDDLELDICCAYSGEEALSWINRTRFDIVLTDISMPGITGLDIQKQILDIWPGCKVIFLTGHNEFGYIQAALRNEGYDYILKTEPEETVIMAVRKAAMEIENEMKREYLLERANRSLALALPALQTKCMLDILDGITYRQEDIGKLFSEFQIGLKEGLPVLLLIAKIEIWPENADSAKRVQIMHGIQDTAMELLSRAARVFSVIYERSTLVWFIQPLQDSKNASPAEEGRDRTALFVHGTMDSIQVYCKRLYGVSLSLAAGRKPVPWNEVSSRYEALRLSLDQASGMACESLLIESGNQEDSCDEATGGEYTMRAQMQRLDILKQCLESGDEEKFLDQLKILMNTAAKSRLYTFDTTLEVYCLLSAMFLSFLNRWKLTELVSYCVDLEKLKNMNGFKDWDDIGEYFEKLSRCIFKYRVDESLKKANRIFGFIRDYVEQNLSGDLSLTRFAELLNFHPFYLSHLFKEITGRSLTEYISEVKIAKAQELLKNSSLKINEIAARLGFDTSSYFGRFFKKHTGTTPQEYRNAQV